jgi:hypothetical protein
MKFICTLITCLMITAFSLAQEREKHHDKEMKEKSGQQDRDNERSNERNDDRVNQHEKIIWAGTGIDLNDKARDIKNIPEKVLASFRQFFPNQLIDNVRKYHGLYAITFSNPVYTTTLIYKADGTFVEARTVATDSILPQAVKEKVKNSKPGYTTSDIVLIEKADKRKFYRLHLKRDNDNRYVLFNEEGNEVAYDY